MNSHDKKFVKETIPIFAVYTPHTHTLLHTHTPHTHTLLHTHTHSWGIIIQKGYQDVGAVKGSVTTKVKGAAFYNGSRQFMDHCPKSDHPWIVYDVADYIVPPQVCLSVCLSVCSSFLLFVCFYGIHLIFHGGLSFAYFTIDVYLQNENSTDGNVRTTYYMYVYGTCGLGMSIV